MNDIQQCMGGFCNRRMVCANYWAPKSSFMPPIERMCAAGIDEPLQAEGDGFANKHFARKRFEIEVETV